MHVTYFTCLQIGRVLGNPAVLQDMAQGIGMATGSPAMSRKFLPGVSFLL